MDILFLRRIYQNLNNLEWYDGWGGWETSGISWHDYWGDIEWEDIDWELIDWSWNWIPELIHVSITPGQIIPNFDKGQNFYTVSVNRDVKIVKITPWATSPSMNIKINDKITRSGIGVYIPIENHNTEVYIEAPVIIETIIGS